MSEASFEFQLTEEQMQRVSDYIGQHYASAVPPPPQFVPGAWTSSGADWDKMRITIEHGGLCACEICSRRRAAAYDCGRRWSTSAWSEGPACNQEHPDALQAVKGPDGTWEVRL